MKVKFCSKCGIEKEINEFHKNKSSKDGYYIQCKICVIEKQQNYKLNNPEKVKDSKKKEYFKNKEKYRNNNKSYQEKNQTEIKLKRDQYYSKNIDTIKIKQNKYRIEHKEIINKKQSEYTKKNSEKIKEYHKIYQKENKETLNKYKRERNKLRYVSDPIYKVQRCIRNRVNRFFKSINTKKGNKTMDIVGCSPIELKIYLETQFKDGMSWENYGYYGWHVDHIIPLSSGKTIDEIEELCHYSNLQPLWGVDNLKKWKNIIHL